MSWSTSQKGALSLKPALSSWDKVLPTTSTHQALCSTQLHTCREIPALALRSAGEGTSAASQRHPDKAGALPRAAASMGKRRRKAPCGQHWLPAPEVRGTFSTSSHQCWTHGLAPPAPSPNVPLYQPQMGSGTGGFWGGASSKPRPKLSSSSLLALPKELLESDFQNTGRLRSPIFITSSFSLQTAPIALCNLLTWTFTESPYPKSQSQYRSPLGHIFKGCFPMFLPLQMGTLPSKQDQIGQSQQ